MLQNIDAHDEISPQLAPVNLRPQKNRTMSSILRDFEVFPDDTITEERELVHIALFAYFKPIEFGEAIKSETWITTMKEEISDINRNNTWELLKLH